MQLSDGVVGLEGQGGKWRSEIDPDHIAHNYDAGCDSS